MGWGRQIRRLAEIPERVAAAWTEHLRQRRRLTLKAAAELVLSLRDEQLAIFAPMLRERGIRLVESRGAGGRSGLEAANREILRAYGSLPPGQRQRQGFELTLPWAHLEPRPSPPASTPSTAGAEAAGGR